MLDTKIPPPFVAFVVGILMWATTSLCTPLHLSWAIRLTVALLFWATGFFTASSAFFAFRKARTTIDPTRPTTASAIVTTGIFRRTRNPMYVGLTLLLIGWSILLAVPITLLGPAFLACYVNFFQIVPEERALLEKFGDEYEQYRRSVRRWL